MDEKMFNATSRHPKAVEKILKLGPVIINKVIDGLTDVERVQVIKNTCIICLYYYEIVFKYFVILFRS